MVDISTYKKKLDKLKEKCLNVDESYTTFLLEDILDVGVVDIFTEDKKYVFWLDIADSLIYEIIDPLFLIYKETKEEEIRNLLFEATKLKQTIDKELSSYSDELTILKDLGINSGLERVTYGKEIKFLLNTKERENKLKLLHHLLEEENLIQCPQEEFLKHFKNASESIVPIYWKGKKNTLIALLKMLSEEHLLERGAKSLYEVVKHFKYKGDEINFDSFEVCLSRTAPKKFYPENILHIVKQVKY